MTDPLFLESVTLENYRSFGALTLPIAPGPSVLVVAGPNGLGKTSLIEGIEWALTGRLRRYPNDRQEEAVDALRRRVEGQIVDLLSVSLGFTDGTIIKRSHPNILECGDGGEDCVGAALKAEGWTHPIHSLSAYLGLTHFLSQSPTLRLTSRSAEQRWEDLSGLTGAQRIDKILGNVSGSKRGLATRQIKVLEDRQAGLVLRKDQLQDLLRRVKDQEALLRAGDSIAPERILAEVKALRQRLRDCVDLEAAPSNDAAEALAALREVVQAAEVQIDERLEALAKAVMLPERWRALKKTSEQLEEDVAAVKVLEELFAAVQAADSRVQSLEKRHALLSRLPGLRKDAKKSEEVHAQILLALQDANAEQERLEVEYRKYVELCEKAITEEGIADGWRALVEQEKRVRDGLESLRREEPKRQELQQAHDRAIIQVEEAEASRGKANIGVIVAEKQSIDLAAAIDEKLGHLQALLALLQAEEIECPLCLTRHEAEPGWVLAKAREAIERQDPALKEANERLVEARRLLEGSEQTLAECHKEVKTANNALQPFLQREGEVTEAADMLRDDYRVGGRPLEELADWLAEKLKEADEKLATTRSGRDALNPDQDLADQLERASGNVRLKALEKDSAETRLRTLKEAVEDSVLEIEENAALVGHLELPKTAEELALARRGHRAAVERLEVAATAFRPELRPSAEGKQPADVAADLAERRRDTDAKRAAVLDAWRAHDLLGPPDQNTLAVQRILKDAAKAEITAIARACARLNSGLTAWHQDARLQDLKHQVSEFVRKEKSSDSQSCLSTLEGEERKIAADIKKWGRARLVMEHVERTVRSEQDAFFTEIINPLQERATIMDRAWSSFPDLQAELQASRVRNKTLLSVQTEGVDAVFRLSEGQAGAKALSFLLAASTAYPWSRWKALLLDDPLQYNDLVHKAAFLDMLRPLVREQRYQVVMSTHDLEEADFIGRKCRNAGIAFSLCRLISLERGGVKVALS